MHTLPALLYHHPVVRFLQEAITMRTLFVCAGFLFMVTVALASFTTNAAHVCLAGESRLVYPVYNKRGVIVGEMQRCGAVHRGCTKMSGGTSYSCSPLMAPKGTFSLR